MATSRCQRMLAKRSELYFYGFWILLFYCSINLFRSCPTARSPRSASPGSHPSTAITAEKSEKLYNAQYWAEQKAANQMAAHTKGDILNFFLETIPAPGKGNKRILEFGCAGGYILASLTGGDKYGIELNPASRQFARGQPEITEVWRTVEEVPAGLTFDFIYSASVLEHVDCPLCELRKLRALLRPQGILVLGLRNDGADWEGQTFAKYFSHASYYTSGLVGKRDPNHHLYTWNELLMANLLVAAGFTPCGVQAQFSAWHGPPEQYVADRYSYCRAGLSKGRSENVQNLWGVAIRDDGDSLLGRCPALKTTLGRLKDCEFLDRA